MEIALEILNQTTTMWSRVLILISVLLLIIGARFYIARKRQSTETGNLKKMRKALELKKLILEIEMIEQFLHQHTPHAVKSEHLHLQEGHEENRLLPLMMWPDKMIFGLLGSFFFLLNIVIIYLVMYWDELPDGQFIYSSFLKDMVITIVCGIGVALIPGNQRWDYFFYGFSLPVILVFLMVTIQT